jgi:hypothetical protein
MIAISLLALGGLLNWQFGNDNVDEEDEGYPWIEGFLLILSMVLVIAASVWLRQLPYHLQNPIAQTAQHVLDVTLTVVKWPLILLSILGVEWLIWWLFIDTSDSYSKLAEDESLKGYFWWLHWYTYQWGIGLMMAILYGFAIAVFYQLPPATQDAILHYKEEASSEITKIKEALPVKTKFPLKHHLP